MIDKWRRGRRRKWLIPLGVFLVVGVLLIPAGGEAATPHNTAFRGRIDQGGVQNVTTVYVTGAGKNPTTYPASVLATIGAAAGSLGNTSTDGDSVIVAFGAGSSGTVCLTALDTAVVIPATVTLPTSGTANWTFTPKKNASCGSQDTGTVSTIGVTYAASASP